MSTTPHINIGHVYPEHSVPADSIVLQTKYCEHCGRPFHRPFSPVVDVPTKEQDEIWVWTINHKREFLGHRTRVRRKDTGPRYCVKCTHSPDPLEVIIAQERYKAQLPGTELQMRHSTHLPRYDDSLNPAGRNTSAHQVNWLSATTPKPVKRRRVWSIEEKSAWVDAVRQAFATRGQMKAEDLVDLIPGCFTPSQAYVYCVSNHIRLKLVKWEKSLGIRGRGKGVYELVDDKDTPKPSGASMVFHPATDACATTMTRRIAKTCDCPTYAGNWGPCATFEEGGNGRCAYCDHEGRCHTPAPTATSVGSRNIRGVLIQEPINTGNLLQ